MKCSLNQIARSWWVFKELYLRNVKLFGECPFVWKLHGVCSGLLVIPVHLLQLKHPEWRRSLEALTTVAALRAQKHVSVNNLYAIFPQECLHKAPNFPKLQRFESNPTDLSPHSARKNRDPFYINMNNPIPQTV